MKLHPALLLPAALLTGIAAGAITGTLLSSSPPGPTTADVRSAPAPTAEAAPETPVTRTGVATDTDPFWDHAGLKYPEPWPAADITRREWLKFDDHAIQCDIHYTGPHALTVDKSTCDFDNGAPLTTITLGPVT